MRGWWVIFSLVILTIISSSIFGFPADTSSTSKQKIIKFGTDYDYYPFEFINEQGKPAGFNIDLVKAISKEINFKIEITLKPWYKVYNSMLLNNNISFTDMFYSSSRDSSFDFTNLLFLIHDQIFIRKDYPKLNSLHDLRNKRVALQNSSFTHMYIKNNLPFIRLIPVDSEPAALKFLSEGKCDAAIVGELVGNRTIKRLKLNNIYATAYPLLPREYSFAVREGNKFLLDKINQGLAKLRNSGKYSSIYARWFPTEKDPNITYKKYFIYSAGLFVLVGLITGGVLFWNSSLKKKVKYSTLELRKELVKHKETSDKLKNQITFTTKLFEGSPLGIAVLDNSGNILNVNSSFEKLFGYHNNEIKNKNLLSYLIPKNLREDTEKKHYEIISKSIIKREEVQRRHKNGELIDVELFKAPLLWNDKTNGIVCFYIDIRDRKKMESEIINEKNKAERLNKLKSEFLAQVSHEIRTPVNIIIGFSNLLEEEIADNKNEILDECLESMREASKRLIRTIDLIINYSEVQTGTYEFKATEFDLASNLKNTIKEFSIIARQKELELIFDNNGDNTVIRGDEYSIQQIFVNLIDNALKYTETGFVKISLRKNGDQILVEIEDTGIGISEKYMKHIFIPFSQEQQGYSRRFDGNGLGLALVKSYCKMNNIEISIESEKNKGTKFILNFLPNEH